MRLSFAAASMCALAVGPALGFMSPSLCSSPLSSPSSSSSSLESSIALSAFSCPSRNDEEDTNNVALDRRTAFRALGTAFASAAAAMTVASSPPPASAGLLDEFGTDVKTIVPTPPPAVKEAATTVVKKAESIIEPNLRSNYYYPTNKVRYLPRIKRCNDAIPTAADMIGTEDWDGATDFANRIADDTILPMKLYTSSLLGGGTNVKVAFAKDMQKATSDFENAQKKLVKAVSKRDRSASSTALEELSVALQTYRTAGRLTGPDGGGDIPSVDEIRRAACRVQGRRFEEKVKARDARVAGKGGGANEATVAAAAGSTQS